MTDELLIVRHDYHEGRPADFLYARGVEPCRAALRDEVGDQVRHAAGGGGVVAGAGDHDVGGAGEMAFHDLAPARRRDRIEVTREDERRDVQRLSTFEGGRHGTGGAIRMIINVFTDITPQKRVEQALRRSEEQFRMLVETLATESGYASVAWWLTTVEDTGHGMAHEAAVSGDVAVPQDSFNRRIERGRSTYDRPHRLTATAHPGT